MRRTGARRASVVGRQGTGPHDLIGDSQVGRAAGGVHYWRRKPKTAPVRRAPRPRPANALDDAERDRIRALLHDPAFVDKAPAQVWACLLDQGAYLCSVSTMYRILRESGESRERRRQATHPSKATPELVAHAPGQMYSWDITKLRGPLRGVWYDLYVMLDIFSRYVVGWRVEQTETGELAAEFLDDVIRTYGKPKAVHAGRGTSMTSKDVAQHANQPAIVGASVTTVSRASQIGLDRRRGR